MARSQPKTSSKNVGGASNSKSTTNRKKQKTSKGIEDVDNKDEGNEDESNEDESNEDEDYAFIPDNVSNATMEANVGFCCYICHCPKASLTELVENDQFILVEETGVYHRRCCHNAIGKVITRDWLPEAQIVAEDGVIEEHIPPDAIGHREQRGGALKEDNTELLSTAVVDSVSSQGQMGMGNTAGIKVESTYQYFSNCVTDTFSVSTTP
jgi:hypothetical protein